jgi:hypothetical protein
MMQEMEMEMEMARLWVGNWLMAEPCRHLCT